ncbi:MAG: RNA polymerase sigma factor [Acidobacteriota bacterium]
MSPTSNHFDGAHRQAVSPQDLDSVFEQHYDRVFRAAYRVVGNPSDAEDVLQTVFLRLARRDQLPGPVEELGPYLYRAAVNAALDTIRSRRRSRAVPLEDASADAEEDLKPDPERRHHGREIRDQLRDALAELSPRAAEIFVLRFIEGYSNKEIAGMLGTSQNAIGVTLHRARGQLKDTLAPLAGSWT